MNLGILLSIPSFTRRGPVWAFIAVGLSFAVATAHAAESVEESKLGRLPDLAKAVFGRDGMHLAGVTFRDGKACLFFDGKLGPEFDGIGQESLVISPDGARVAFAGRTGTKWQILVDGKPGPELDGVGRTVFGPDGKHFAYTAKKSGRWQVVLDGKPSPEFDGFGQGTPIFSSDPGGKSLAYTAYKDTHWRVVLDDKEGPAVDTVNSMLFSPDGNRLAYSASKAGRSYVVVDGNAGSEYEAIGGLVFSSDAKHLAYVARKHKKLFVVLDGRPLPEFDVVSSPVFSPNGMRLAYVTALNDQKWRLMLDDRLGPDFDKIGLGTLRFSPDSKRIAYAVGRGNKFFAVADTETGPECEELGTTIVFSSDGKRLAYNARINQSWRVVLNEQPGPEFDRIHKDTPLFSADGKRLAYAADKGGKWFVVLDGEIGPPYEGVGTPIFSKNGLHFAYEASDGNKRFIILDGKPGNKYDAIIQGGPSFSDEGKLEYLATKSESGVNYLYRVTHTPGAQNPANGHIPAPSSINVAFAIPSGFESITNAYFGFAVPSAWRAMLENELAIFRREYEKQSQDQFRQHYGRSEGYDWGIEALTGYFSPQREATFIALILKVPPEPEGAVEAAWKRSREIIASGKQSGMLKTVYSNEKAELNGLPALKSDFEMGDGKRMLGVAVEAKPGAVLQANILCDPKAFAKFEKDFQQVMNSLVVLQKQKSP